MNRKLGLIGLVLATLIVSGTACNHPAGPTSTVQPVIHTTPGSGGTIAVVTPPTTPGGRTQGMIYVPGGKGGDDDALVARPVTFHATQSPALASLNALAQTSDSPLPSGTQIRGVKLDNGLATVDLSREFQTNFHGGTSQETDTVNSILETLGQFPTIDRVQILVEGKPIYALSQLEIDSPLNVIRPNTVRQASGGG